MLHPQKDRVKTLIEGGRGFQPSRAARLSSRSFDSGQPLQAARAAKRELARLARPAGDFDPSRYFRGPGDLAFYNVGTSAMRALARSIHRVHRLHWSIDEAVAFADDLITDRHLEVKSVGIEVVARYRRDFTPRL